MVAAEARYVIHQVNGNVQVISGGKTEAAKAGAELKATDEVQIPQGAKISVLNELNKRIYTSTKSGRFTVTTLMIESTDVASNNTSSINKQLNFGSKKGNSEYRVHAEKGMSRRSLAVYDPNAGNLQIDSKKLGEYVARAIRTGSGINEEMPVVVANGLTPEGGLFFSVNNNIDMPVYFNVVKVDAAGKVTISQLAQPAGSYVLLPQQTIRREHLPAIDSSEKHLLIMTNCQYNLDEVLDVIRDASAQPAAAGAVEQLPVYIRKL